MGSRCAVLGCARQEAELGAEFVNEEPPTDEDDVHVPQNVPDVVIEAPTDTMLNSREISIEARVRSAAR